MSERLSWRLGVAAALVFSVALIFLAEKAVAQTTCPGGTVAITAATRAVATAAGLPASVSCWDPNNASTGEAAGQAKLWLEQHATTNANVVCLNSTYAEDLEKLMQAVPGGPPTITDAYRSPQAQAALPAGSTQVGACGSYHQYGLAADFNNASKQTLLWMRENAPTYGLTPIPSLNVQTGCSKVSSFCDPGHIQIQGPLPPRNQCGICGSSGSGVLPVAAGSPPISAIPDDTQYVPSALNGGANTNQLPAGYCVVSTNPIIAMPCNTNSAVPLTQTAPLNSSLPYAPQTPLPANYSSAPQTVQQPLPVQTTTSQPISATPTLSPTVTATPALTTANPASSLLSPLLQQSNPVAMPVLATPTSTQLFLQQILNPTQATTAISTSSSFASEILNILQQTLATTSLSATTSLTAATSVSPQSNIASGTYGFQGQPITSTGFVDNTDASYVTSSAALSSPLQQALGQLKNVLSGFLHYLGSL